MKQQTPTMHTSAASLPILTHSKHHLPPILTQSINSSQSLLRSTLLAEQHSHPITQTLPYSLKNPHPITQTPSPPHSATFKHHYLPILQLTPFQHIPNLIPTLMTCPSLASNSTQTPTLHASTASLPHSYTPHSKPPNTIATPSPNTTSIPSLHAPPSPPPCLCLVNCQ